MGLEWIKGSITPELGAFSAQLITTLILIGIFRFFFWKPLKEFAQKRRNYIKHQYDDVENLKRESETFILNAEAQKNKIDKESSQIISQAKKEGENIKSKAIEDAKFEANRKIERAEDEIKLAKEKAQDEVKVQAAEIAELIAQKLILNNSTIKDQDKLIDEALGEL